MRQSPPPSLAELTLRLEALARSMEMVLLSGGAARGQLYGADVRLEIRMRREIILRARIPTPLPTGLQLDSEQAVAASRPSVGFQDIQVGTPSFDECVHVRALNPVAAIRLLRDEELLRRLPLFLTAHPRARLTGDELIVPLPSELSSEQVRGVVKEAAELAVAFGRAGAAEAGRVQRSRAEVRSAASGSESAPESSQQPAPEEARREERESRPRPGAGVAREESGLAYLNRMRRSFRSRRRWMFALRVGSVPFMVLALFWAWDYEWWSELVFMVTLFVSLGLSTMVWRCPACNGALDQNGEVALSGFSLRSCPHCAITLNPKD